MARLTVADLLRHHVALAPIEATALTLAVARELDRCRAAGDASLPDDAAIVLHRTGEVSFTAVPVTSALPDVVALCALLARLLHVDDRACAERLLHEGMTGTAFRTALARVTPEDPSVLAAVYWRGASAVRGMRSADVTPAPRTLTRSDRRRAQPAAADLRRSIRRLEHELYDERQRRTSIAAARARARRVVPWIAATLFVVLLGMLQLAWMAPAAPEIAGRTVQPATTEPYASSPLSPSRGVAPAIAPRVAPRHIVRRARNNVAPAGPARALASRRALPTFAGGTRTMPWSAR